MDWFHHYEQELALVFKECAQTLACFPEPLNSQGLVYLTHFNVFEEASHKNYICYLLPFWQQESCRITSEDCRQMAKGNVFLMLYFFIQDDVMDHPTETASARLPLANMLYIEFLNIYRAFFPGESTFWGYYNRYIAEWAESVSNERNQDYFLNDQIRLARKASPLKLSSTAALLMSGQDILVPQSEKLLDDVLLTLQMLDDYEDWEEDLEQGNYNSLLGLAQHQRQTGTGTLTPEEMRDFIFTAGGLEQYARIALEHQGRLPEMELKIPHLLAFQQDLTDSLQQISRSLEADKQLLRQGGFAYWLSKHMNSPESL